MSRRTHARAAACIALAAAVLGTVAAPARGDGDPASDVLIYQQAFFPYVSPSDSAKAKLSAAVEAAKRAGYPVRVAVIQQRQDLGADPELFGKPQLYARFLDSEIMSARYLGVLLVVMPQGFGVGGGGKLIHHQSKFVPRPIGPLERALAHVRPPHNDDPTALTLAAVPAVRALAAAGGHPLPGSIPAGSAGHAPGGGSGTPATTVAIVAGLAAVAVAAVAMIAVGIRRGRAAGPAS